MTDRHALGLTIWGECRGEPLEGKLAVASVLRNRLATGRWGHTYESVCRARSQFSCWNPTDPNSPALLAFAAQLESGATPEDPALLACLWIADGLLAGFFPSPVGAATHYFATSMKDAPAWAKTGEYVTRIANHMFFAKVP